MNLDWRNILPIGGSRQKAFEKLCVQLADSEKPAGAKFVPTGDPDAGVECYAVLHDGSEWGWQAKYFLGPLSAPQWRQLDDSVKTALDKHPALVFGQIKNGRGRADGVWYGHPWWKSAS